MRWFIAVILLGAGIMALAGDWRSPYLWSIVAVIAVLGLWAVLTILEPDLANERFRPPTQGSDATALAWIRLSAATLFVFAPLDSGRLHWSAAVPATARIVGICGFALGAWFTLHAMASNRFFSSVIRVQRERGHHVIDGGPYATIRHPGYLGMATFAPMVALAFGSWWALLPAGVYTTMILRRAGVEDRFLRSHLPGYVEYATRVRFRILPGIW